MARRFLTGAALAALLLGGSVLPMVAQVAKPADAQLAWLLDTGSRGATDVARAEKLLRQGADIRTHSAHGVTVLMFAAKAGSLRLMRAAIQGGVDVGAHTQEGWTALLFVMGSRSVDKVRLLLDAGADPNAPDASGRTPLMMATYFKFRGGINLLLSRGADIKARNSKGHTVLAYTDKHPGITRLLEQNGAIE